jgi:hypothetical protein
MEALSTKLEEARQHIAQLQEDESKFEESKLKSIVEARTRQCAELLKALVLLPRASPVLSIKKKVG